MFTITINGVDRTSSIQWRNFRKRDNLNQQVDHCVFDIWKYGTHTYLPEVGQEVVIERDSVAIFGGVITRIDEKIEGSNKLIYRIQVVDYSQYLKRELVTERFTNTTVQAIIDALIATYTTEGFTTTNVDGSLIVRSFSFNRLTVAECLQKLSDALSYVWYVDYDKDIHFFPKNTETAPITLTDTSGNYIYNSLTITTDLSQIRNAVLVQGGESVSTTTRTEFFSGDGARDQFALANKYDSLPTVTVGVSPQTVGVEYLDEDASFDVMWNFNEKYLRFTAGNVPASGTNNIEVEGTYLFPIVVQVPSPTSQALFGVYEFAVTDKSIKSQSEAIARAQAELTKHQNEHYEGEFRTYTDGLRSGQVLTINSVQRGKVIDVLIQSVDARLFDPTASALEYTVNFATYENLGIIDYLQRQQRDKEIITDDKETLLNYFPLTDTVTGTDSLATPTTSTGPYVYGTAVCGYCTCS